MIYINIHDRYMSYNIYIHNINNIFIHIGSRCGFSNLLMASFCFKFTNWSL